MKFEKTYDVPKDGRLIIKLPEKFRRNDQVKVIIKEAKDTRKSKIEKLKQAFNDPLFKSDVDEVVSDFAYTHNKLK